MAATELLGNVSNFFWVSFFLFGMNEGIVDIYRILK